MCFFADMEKKLLDSISEVKSLSLSVEVKVSGEFNSDCLTKFLFGMSGPNM